MLILKRDLNHHPKNAKDDADDAYTDTDADACKLLKKTFSDAPTHSALLTLTVDRAKWRQKLSLATRQVVEERCPTHFCAREIDPASRF